MAFMKKALGVIGLGVKSQSIENFTWADGRGAPTEVAGERVTPESALALSAVWACSMLVSGTISSLPFEVYRKNVAGAIEVATDHPLHNVIHANPNSEQTALDFWDFISLSIELWGNGYARIERAGSRVISLHPILPESMSVRRDVDGALRYRWSENGVPQSGIDRDVLHIRGPGGNPLGGMSTLKFARQTFSSALAADRTAAAMFRNGLRSSAVIKFKEWLTEPQRRLAETMLVERHAGALNSGRPIIAEGGMEYEAISINPEDAQMLETRQFSIEEVCRFFQVPPVLIGHAGASTAWPTSVEQQLIMFQTFYLRKRLKRIEQAVTKQLFSHDDHAGKLKARFNMEGLLRGDSAARASYYRQMTQIGAMTINEVRARENLPDVVGGETPRMQRQNVPITQAGSEENQ